MALEEELLLSCGGDDETGTPLLNSTISSSFLRNNFNQTSEKPYIFDELPKATVISVSRPDSTDFSAKLLSYSYTIEFQYKQFKWRLVKKASNVIYLHFILKKRAIIEEFHEKQEQVKEWVQYLGLGDHVASMQDDDEGDEDTSHLHHKESTKNRNVPSRAALPIICPTLGRQQTILNKSKVAMQGYLNHFLGNMDIVNSREVCNFLEVSKLSFISEYGPKLKENYVMVKHPRKSPKEKDDTKCCMGNLFSCCKGNWRKVWAVLKPGFLALLEDPFDTKPLNIILFSVLPTSNGKGGRYVSLAKQIREGNPLCYTFMVSSESHCIKLRTRSNAKARDWVAAINGAGLGPPESWCYPHRFGSFAPPRGLTEDGSQAQWFVDGAAAFEAIALAMEEAESEIFITDWWLCPELYLRRPFDACGSSRLDAILERKAKQGVQIYILLYKEVTLAMNINSVATKRKLLNIHQNVRVLRYPDHLSSGIYLWSHHEKLVIVDYKISFIGGLDLCFGRYDNFEHKVSDFPSTTWPGKDYYNPRQSQPNSWEETMQDVLDRSKYPRMPWHDVHCALWGPPCLDIARHFVQRWNYAKRSKAEHLPAIPLLMPQNTMEIPHYVETVLESESKNVEDNSCKIDYQDSLPSPVSSEDIPLLFPREANPKDAVNGNLNFVDLEKTHLPSNQHKGFSESPCLQLNDFADDLNSVDLSKEMCLNAVEHSYKWWELQDQGDQVVSFDEARQVGPRTSCHCQIIRSVSQWSAGTSQTEDSIHNAYCSLIDKAEYYIYIENQFFISGLSQDEAIRNRVSEALYTRILRAYKQQKCFRVIIVMPLLPDFQGSMDDGGAAPARALTHWQYRTICRGQNSLLHNLNGVLGHKLHDYISFYSLRNYGRLFDGGPLVTNQVYVHSKVMIIDDRIALIGSANINDRSLLGSRDSEMGVVIEDKEFVHSSMNGKPWKAGKFAFSLRLSLWSEHLGLSEQEISKVSDPVVDATYKDIWMTTAKTNTEIYQDIFACIPNDHLHSRSEIRESIAYWKSRLGHTTIDLGVAPEKLEAFQKGDIKVTDPMERLKLVKGHLVSFPLDFMSQEEDLRPVFNESEFYVAAQVFQ